MIDSTGALALADIPKRLLVLGGGIIGLEMGCVYDALGSRVSVVELTDQLIPGCDPDLVRVLARRIGDRYEAVFRHDQCPGFEAPELTKPTGEAGPGRQPQRRRAKRSECECERKMPAMRPLKGFEGPSVVRAKQSRASVLVPIDSHVPMELSDVRGVLEVGTQSSPWSASTQALRQD